MITRRTWLGRAMASSAATAAPAFAEVADELGVSVYQVTLAWHLAQADVVVPIPAAPALARIEGARIAFVDNSKQNADVFLGSLKPLLERHGAQPGATVRKLAPKDPLAAADLQALASCDAVVQCFGD